MKQSIYFLIFVISVSILSIYFNTYKLKCNIENFIDYDNSLQIKSNFEKEKDTPLIKISESNYSDSFLSRLNFMISKKQFYSISGNDIYQKIIEDLQECLQRICKEYIDGPVYILIYQDIDNEPEKEKQIGINKLLTRLYILYPSYQLYDNKILKNNKGILQFKKYFKSQVGEGSVYSVNSNHKLFTKYIH